MIEIGAMCMLRACNCDYNVTNNADIHANVNRDTYSHFVGGKVDVTGCIIAAQPHLEDNERVLYYFHTTNITPTMHLKNYNNRCTEKVASVDTKVEFDASERKLSENTHSTNTQVKSTIALPCQTKTTRLANSITISSSSTNHLLDGISTRGGNDSAGRNELTLNESTNQYFTSSEKYVYRFDGWYDYDDLIIVVNDDVTASQSIQGSKSSDYNTVMYNVDNAQLKEHNKENVQETNRNHLEEKSDGDTVKFDIPDAWLELMRKDNGPCEIVYLCYRFKPWFRSPFHALQYLSAPCSQVCYSVYICHRCLTPFYSEAHLQCHLEGYCTKYEESPPGELIYHDEESNRKVYYVDGALHLHYVRCLSLLGKCFIESKLLHNDVDIYELFLLTIPRDALPFINDKPQHLNNHENDQEWNEEDNFDTNVEEYNMKSASVIYKDESAFREAACTFDATHWNGDVVAGYVSRIKHAPNHTLSCILVLPCFQRSRLGFFLLDMAYFLTRERQRQCGCVEYCGTLGGKVSRPLSPSGEALLLRYWRSKLENLLWRRAEQGLTNEFDGIDDLCNAISLHAIHKDDLEFLLVNDHIAFYAYHERSAVNRVVSLVFDHAKVYKNMNQMYNQNAIAPT